ncbi:MAG: TetR/AcrR family transcriptional regulator, partial [Lachnospiraceae bacterium]|nr:TetR/AcrR family transcriptional regulator [Lachnospiraceae bacterium]
MARNKHPEETVSRILNVATRLFMEKGYEHTSIQDIIDDLGGLSKGAIYHHFKSKEEILIAVTDRMTEESNRMLAQIRELKGLSGKEKLKKIFKDSINRPEQDEIFTAAPNLGSNPRLLFSILRETMDDAAPHYIQPIIE